MANNNSRTRKVDFLFLKSHAGFHCIYSCDSDNHDYVERMRKCIDNYYRHIRWQKRPYAYVVKLRVRESTEKYEKFTIIGYKRDSASVDILYVVVNDELITEEDDKRIRRSILQSAKKQGKPITHLSADLYRYVEKVSYERLSHMYDVEDDLRRKLELIQQELWEVNESSEPPPKKPKIKEDTSSSESDDTEPINDATSTWIDSNLTKLRKFIEENPGVKRMIENMQ